MIFNPMLLCDFYKLSHRIQYPENTTKIYSTWTPRTSRIKNIDKVVCFGLQGFIKKYLIDYFNDNFFNQDINLILEEYKNIVKYSLNDNNPETQHIEDLHKLGYLPIKIKSVPEGMSVPIKTPMFTIENTLPTFYWVTNFLETLLSCELWQPMTSATIAKEYKKVLDYYANMSSDIPEMTNFQGHDFSMRGMSSLNSAALSGAGHLLSFSGTDTIPAIQYLQKYYNAQNVIGMSIPATEHSVQCTYQDDLLYFKKMITEKYPSGLVSIVSDGYDFWKVIEEVLPALKQDILKRNGKVVIRPDSGDPVKIICGDPESDNILIKKGLIECLYDIFGGEKNSKGFIELNPNIGAIYGDSITIERCTEICKKLTNKGFSSTNCVFGIGSYTYQYNTRDTFGFALKSTLSIIDGKVKFIFKDPKTDDGTKKSQRGAVAVFKSGAFCDNLTLNTQVIGDILQTVFKDGKLLKEYSLNAIKQNLNRSYYDRIKYW